MSGKKKLMAMSDIIKKFADKKYLGHEDKDIEEEFYSECIEGLGQKP